jgi:hypothetical protein
MPWSRLTHAGSTVESSVAGDQGPRAMAQLIDKPVNLAVLAALGDTNRLFRGPFFRHRRRDALSHACCPAPLALSR